MFISSRGASLLFFTFFFLSASLISEEFGFYRLSLEDGLSSNSVYRIEQDSTGYMWFGTFSGLNRYDGREIRTYKPEPGKSRSISSPVIFDLMEDSRGRLWVGTDGGGLNLYNSGTDDFTLFRHDRNDESSLGSNNVYALCEDGSGRLWVGTGGGGLSLFNEERRDFSHYRASEEEDSLDSDVIRVIYCDSRGNLWIGTEGGGLSLRTGENSFRNFRTDERNPSSISSDNIRSLFEDSRGNLWVGTEGGGLNLLDRRSFGFAVVSNPGLKDPEHYSVRSIREDREGNIWVGTEGQGIFIIDEKGRILTSIRHSDGNSASLSKDKIRHIFIDRNGLMWIGTRDGGVNRYNPGNIGFSYREKKDIRAVYEDRQGLLWIGSDGGGLGIADPLKGIIPAYGEGGREKARLSSNQVYAILEDSAGYLWVGTDGGGLNRIDRESGEITVFSYDPGDPGSLGSNTVWSLLEDSYGTLWAGTEGGGLNSFDSSAGTFRSYSSIPENSGTLNGNSIRAIFEDSDRVLWVGTWDGGLNRYDRDKGVFRRYTRIPHDSSSLSDSSVNTIFEDSNRRLWIGTAAGGLNLMDRQSETFTHFRTDEGLAGDNIFAILEDDEGFLWISSDRGLTRFHPGSGETLNFGEADGLPGNEFSINACEKLVSGEMVFGSPEGINRFYPGKIEVDKTIPPVVITDIFVMNQAVSYAELPEGELIIDYDDNILSIHFAVLDYTAPGRNRYAVRMQGLQKEWTDLENQNSIVYNSLPPGEYLFRVKGADNNGIWNERGASLPVRVLPPWWNRPFFHFSVVVLAIGLILAFIRFRLKRLEDKNRELREYSIHIQDVREEERTWVAREVHDELGQTLSALKMEIFRQSEGNRESMLELVDMSLESVKDLSTRLRPKVLDNLSIGEAVVWLVRDFSDHTGIEVTEDLDETMTIDNGDVKTALFRICQEVLTNVLRHSGADRIEVALGKTGNSAELRISDNGCGIPEGALQKNRSFGIRGIKERCRYLGGQCKIGNSVEGGTVINVRLPLNGSKEVR